MTGVLWEPRWGKTGRFKEELSELSTKGIHQAGVRQGRGRLQAVEQRVQWRGALEKHSMSETSSVMKSRPRCSQGWGQPFEFHSISSPTVTKQVIWVTLPLWKQGEEALGPFRRQIWATQEDPHRARLGFAWSCILSPVVWETMTSSVRLLSVMWISPSYLP